MQPSKNAHEMDRTQGACHCWQRQVPNATNLGTLVLHRIEDQAMEIPYRLETPEAISEAMNANLLGLGEGYKTMLSVAKRVSLQIPQGLAKARPVIAKSFTIPTESVVSEHRVLYEKLPNLEAIRGFSLIEGGIPWTEGIALYKNLRDFVRSFPCEVQKLCLVDPIPARLPQMLESALAIRRFLRREIICYTKSKRTKYLNQDQFKRLLVGYSLFDTRNEDVLQALVISRAGNDQPLYQNAIAELLFARLPASIEELIVINPKAIRRKLFSKIATLPIRALQKTNLYGQLPANIQHKDLVPTLHRIARFSQRLNIAADTRRSFHDYVLSIADSIGRVGGIYRELFIGKELGEMQKLYVPRTIMKSGTSKRIVLSAPKSSETLEFYPTKDYLDLFRGKISKDCIDVHLSEHQLMTPMFFNVRIFRNAQWIGNIYMLDFAQSDGVLLVDRIQIPRGTKAEYVHFFEDLVEALAQLFADVDYKEILMPLVISNHASVQKKYNSYRKKLPKRKIKLYPAYFDRFESLRRHDYYVIHRKNETADK